MTRERHLPVKATGYITVIRPIARVAIVLCFFLAIVEIVDLLFWKVPRSPSEINSLVWSVATPAMFLGFCLGALTFSARTSKHVHPLAMYTLCGLFIVVLLAIQAGGPLQWAGPGLVVATMTMASFAFGVSTGRTTREVKNLLQSQKSVQISQKRGDEKQPDKWKLVDCTAEQWNQR